MSGGSLRNGGSPVQPDVVVANASPLFSDRIGPPIHHHGRCLKLQAGISLGSLPASGAHAAMPGNRNNSNKKGASVTRIITSSDKNVPTQSTKVMSPDGAKDGASVRLNYSAKQSSTSNSAKGVLGTITIGGVKKDGGNQVDKTAAGGQRYLHDEYYREQRRREKLREEQLRLEQEEQEGWKWWCTIL